MHAILLSREAIPANPKYSSPIQLAEIWPLSLDMLLWNIEKLKLSGFLKRSNMLLPFGTYGITLAKYFLNTSIHFL